MKTISYYIVAGLLVASTLPLVAYLAATHRLEWQEVWYWQDGLLGFVANWLSVAVVYLVVQSE